MGEEELSVELSLTGFTEYIVECCGVNTDLLLMVFVELLLFSLNFFGDMFFDTLTCEETCYVAVVHPVEVIPVEITSCGTSFWFTLKCNC